METDLIGWREGVLLLAGLAALYLAIALFQLLRLGRGRSASKGREEPRVVEDDSDGSSGVGIGILGTMRAAPGGGGNDPKTHARWGAMHRAGERMTPETTFGEHLADFLVRADLEREVRRLRVEVEEMRKEIRELRAARNISPHYAEALTMAQRGANARQIADRMGISLAEAELVYALSRGESLFDEGEKNDPGEDEGAAGMAEDSALDTQGRRR